MTRIEELEQCIDEAVEKFRLEMNKFKAELKHIKASVELKESKKEKCGKWKPQVGDEYWFRNTNNAIGCERFYFDSCHKWRVENLPIFPTKEECEKYWHFMDTVKEKSYEFSVDEWEDGAIEKYSVLYDYKSKNLDVGCNWTVRVLDRIYFKTQEDAQYIIDNFKEELMKYWL